MIPFSIVSFIFAKRMRINYLVILVACVPFAFYVLTLILDSLSSMSGGILGKLVAPTSLFNSRYGIQMLVPVLLLFSVSISTLTTKLKGSVARNTILFCSLLLILGQSFYIIHLTPVTFQEGIQSCGFTLSFTKKENIYFEEHYDTGGILTDMHISGIDPRNFDTNLAQLINESSGSLWKAALIHPERFVHWIAYNPNDPVHDGVAQAMITQHNAFLAHYRLVLTGTDGLKIYLLKTVTSIPNRPLPQSWIAAEQWCKGLSN